MEMARAMASSTWIEAYISSGKRGSGREASRRVSTESSSASARREPRQRSFFMSRQTLQVRRVSHASRSTISRAYAGSFAWATNRAAARPRLGVGADPLHLADAHRQQVRLMPFPENPEGIAISVTEAFEKRPVADCRLQTHSFPSERHIQRLRPSS